MPLSDHPLPTGTQQLNLSDAPVLRTRVSAVDKGLTQVQFEQYQKNNLDLPDASAATPVAYVPPPPAQTPAPLPPPPSAVAQAPVAQSPAQATPVPGTDSFSVQDRIDRIYGRARSAEELNASLESKVLDLQRRLDEGFRAQPAFQQPYASPAPSSQPFDPYGAAPTQAPPSHEAPVSRAELANLLQAQRQELALTQAHTVARLEAEREYPDVFNNPELRQAAQSIFARDRSLQTDPLGIKKAVLMARGLSVSDARAQAPAASPTSVRKEAMSGIGASVPDGNGTAPDQATRLTQALHYARTTGRDEDFFRAYLIREGRA